MATEKNQRPEGAEGAGSATTVRPKRRAVPKRQPSKPLPPWKVLLHNDDKNDTDYVVHSIMELTPLKEPEAFQRMEEAHKSGLALLLTTHRERAELYQEQFQSKNLTVTIEPTEA